MKRSMKRLSAALLSAVLLLSALSACAQTTESPEETSASAAEAVSDAEDTRYPRPTPEDLDGYVLRVATSTWNGCNQMILPEWMSGDEISNAVYESNRKVEEDYHVTLELCLMSSMGAVTSAISSAAAGGLNDYALSYNHDTETVGNALKGCFLNLRGNESIDFDAPWWTRTADAFTVSGKQYFASNHMTYSGIFFALVLCYNKDVAKQRSITIPYDKVMNGKWTIGEMTALIEDCRVDLNGDGKMAPKDDLYGFTSTPLGLIQLQVGCGFSALGKGEEGELVFNADQTRLTTFLDKYEALMTNGFTADTNGSNYGAEYFVDGHALFDYFPIRIVPQWIRDTSFAYGFLPAPKLDEQQENYVTAAYDVYWAIPAPALKEAEAIGMVTEALGWNCYYDVLPTVFETTLKCKLSDSPEDSATFDILRETLFVDSGYAFQKQVAGLPNFVSAVTATGSSGVGSFFAKNSTTVTKALSKFNKSWNKLP